MQLICKHLGLGFFQVLLDYNQAGLQYGPQKVFLILLFLGHSFPRTPVEVWSMALEEQGVLNFFTKSFTSIFLGLIPKIEINGFFNISNDLRSRLYVVLRNSFFEISKF